MKTRIVVFSVMVFLGSTAALFAQAEPPTSKNPMSFFITSKVPGSGNLGAHSPGADALRRSAAGPGLHLARDGIDERDVPRVGIALGVVDKHFVELGGVAPAIVHASSLGAPEVVARVGAAPGSLTLEEYARRRSAGTPGWLLTITCPGCT